MKFEYRDKTDHDDLLDVIAVVCETGDRLRARGLTPRITMGELRLWSGLSELFVCDRRLWDGITTYRLADLAGLHQHHISDAIHDLAARDAIFWWPGRRRPGAVSLVSLVPPVRHGSREVEFPRTLETNTQEVLLADMAPGSNYNLNGRNL